MSVTPPLIPVRAQVIIAYALILIWLGLMGWTLAWPPTWATLPILLGFGYITFRLVFELTLNRAHIPTLASNFIARQKIAKILEQTAQRSTKDPYVIVDLGSGRGQLARHIAKKIPHAKVMGLEFARIPHLQASFVQRLLGPKNLSFECGDFWQHNCSTADAVVMYLGPITAQRMGEKLRQELKQGSVIVSHTFPLLGGWTPTDVLTFYTPFKETVYVYRQL